ncbi:MAG: hypothetical protein IJ480_02770, partial [Clostridia bacterium]|nr:hypothetical protein [Clostridia bacterium]
MGIKKSGMILMQGMTDSHKTSLTVRGGILYNETIICSIWKTEIPQRRNIMTTKTGRVRTCTEAASADWKQTARSTVHLPE